RLEPAAEVALPEEIVAEQIYLRRMAIYQLEPLHIIGIKDVVAEREVHPYIGSGGRHDGRQVRWQLTRRRPLIIAGIGAAPHGHLAVAIRLFSQPLHDVISVVGFLDQRSELPF